MIELHKCINLYITLYIYFFLCPKCLPEKIYENSVNIHIYITRDTKIAKRRFLSSLERLNIYINIYLLHDRIYMFIYIFSFG